MGSARTLLTLVRHGQTSANIDGVWHGSTNSPLTEHGHGQAAAAAAFIEANHKPVAKVYASPLDRAHHTAEKIADRLGLTPELDPGLAEIAEEGARLTAVDYLRAFQERIDVAVALSALLEDYDFLLTPTVPIAAFEAGVEVPKVWPHKRWQTWSPFSLPFNLSQQPAVTVPCGLTADGLPVGLQVVAAKHRDHLTLQAAWAYEVARSNDGVFTRPLTSVREPNQG